MIVEDDPTIASILAKELEKWNYKPYLVTDFQNILEQFQVEGPQLVLMDIQLPAFNGYHWCQEIRKVSQVPIIFISSRSENMDIVMAIQMGADDYIQKPFDLTVTLAKIQALLRRTYDFTEKDNYLRVGEVVLRAGESKLIYKEAEIDLTRNELRTLELLFQHKNDYVSREAIMVHLWEDESFIDDNTLAVTITRLRKKLKNMGLEQLIVTKKGLGYSVVEAEE
ncbi:response regulator transcription factor [Jeotgalibaca ciconiae]|uniref:Response regulator transcription factor n=2 Tax=Jeotgalibaca ciconiae TaxID=2496265 RepID=A0A3Q9BMS2_9LACT|nr:response regulator transcription factor [Jeotgalibaca ciconiae]